MEMNETMQRIVGRSILDLPMQENDAAASTVRDYLQRLLRGVWIEGEGFDGKRPFGNSGWQDEVYKTLGKAGLIEVDSDGSPYNYEAAEELVLIAIDAL